MNYFNFLSSPTAHALGRTILYSLWQAFIVFICLRLVLKCIPHASSRFKYAISYIAHLSVLAWFVITLLQQLPSQQGGFIDLQMIQPGALQQQISYGSTSSVYNGLSFFFLNSYLPWIVAFYFAGIAWFTLRLTLSYFQTIRIRQKGLIDFDDIWQSRIGKLLHTIGIRNPVYTYISRFVETPVMIGFFRPVILLPLAAFNNLSPQQIEAILLHELAHIRRNDYLLNLFQSVIDTVLFFNPFAWWISKNIRREREKSCDEMVLQLSEPYLYARALLALEEFGQNNRLAMAASSKQPQLLHRIKNIMEMKNKHTNLRHKLIALAIVITTALSVAWIYPKENIQSHAEKKAGSKTMAASINQHIAPTNEVMANAIDTNAPKIVPPLPPAPPINILATLELPLPPMPPVPPVIPLPPMPPVPPLPSRPLMPDTIPLIDSISTFRFKKLDSVYAQKLREYFNSTEWKKQMQDIKKSTATIQQNFQSKEWKQQLEGIRKNNEKFQKELLNNEAWKAHMKDIKKNAIKQMDEIKKNTDSLKHYFNIDEWKKQQRELKHIGDSIKAYFNSYEWKENYG